LFDEGRVYVVYWAVKKSWFRAVVESIFVDSVSCQACCFLVDHGEKIVVPSEQIRVAMENFLQLPFWVQKFHLAGIKPTTLRVSLLEEKAELKPSARWDSSATLFLHKLLQASTLKEAVLLEPESDSTPIKLYVTVGDIKICVNDDLVAKRFAYYSTKSGDGLEEGDRLPVMLSYSILTQSVSPKPTAQTQPPPDQQSTVITCDPVSRRQFVSLPAMLTVARCGLGRELSPAAPTCPTLEAGISLKAAPHWP
uniref:RNA helicase n=1 Tax=Astatotilapia calliptera TaxID=8154 RepID=A0A3P8NJR1_ASTCA